MMAKVVTVTGDITKQEVEAVVNAANKELGGGSGVNGAIRKAGGPEIQKYCEELRATTHQDGLPTGQSVITPGGKLPAKWIIHTVGPKYGQENGREAELLASCYRTVLALAEEHGLKTVAFPAISTGVYGYPQEEAAKVVCKVLRKQLMNLKMVQEIRLVFASEEQEGTFRKLWLSMEDQKERKELMSKQPGKKNSSKSLNPKEHHQHIDRKRDNLAEAMEESDERIHKEVMEMLEELLKEYKKNKLKSSRITKSEPLD